VPSAIVVGAGVFGASIAHRLALSDWDVTLVERYTPGHVRAASGDESRLIRFAHGAERWYTRSAWRSRDLWRELERASGTELLVETGIAWFARRDHGWEAQSQEALAAEGIPHERLSLDAASDLFPSFDGSGLAFVLYEPRAGILRARDAVRAVVRLARERGVTVRVGEARPEGERVAVAGDVLDADAVIWACGAWLPGVFPNIVRLKITKQDVFYFGASPEWAAPPVPGWVDYEGATYGLGDLDGRGVKVAPDREGRPFDPDRDARTASREAENDARAYIAARFPGLRDAPLVGTRTCPYSLTPDTHFVIALHPEHDRVWLVGGGSGHGFKHGPALAEYVVSLVEGNGVPDERFGLEERLPATKLRTAGAT
jgi:glycine/D-amino acid oxidase-like deaminating enzyme